jgi:hypothetical protein
MGTDAASSDRAWVLKKSVGLRSGAKICTRAGHYPRISAFA